MYILAVQIRTLYVQGVLRKRVSIRGVLFQKVVIYPLLACLAASVKIVTDMQRHAAYHNKHWRRAF